MSDEEGVPGGWDDPEDMEPVETLTDTGDTWVWVPPWERLNGYGADHDLWGNDRPPLTTKLRFSMLPYEIAHFEGSTFRERLLDFTARAMLRRRVDGCDPEDVLADALIDMERVREREGFLVGSTDYLRVAQVVIRRRVTDLLRSMGGQKNRGTRMERRDSLMYGEYIARRKSRPFESTDPEDDVADQDPLTHLPTPEFIPTVFPVDFVDTLSVVLTPRELEAVTWTYESDLSGDQVAERMKIAPSTVRVLLTTARERLSKHFGDYSR